MSAPGRPSAVAHLRRPATIRERCANILATGLGGGLTHFRVEPSRLPQVADFVAAVTRRRYPGLAIPYHSRWRHLDAGGVARVAALGAALSRLPAAERARAKIDLIVTSVLLDAGAGETWRFREEHTGQTFARSEGLAVASFRMFEAGLFSSDPSRPWRTDAAVLMDLEESRMARGFQASAANPLAGLDGRVGLLKRLGRAMKGAPHLFDALRGRATQSRLDAPIILEAVLEALEEIWPERIELDGVGLGDTWPHPAAAGSGPSAGLVPLHKLSQWLAYSLVEPLEEAGVEGADRGPPRSPRAAGGRARGAGPDRASPDQGPGRRHLGSRARAGRRPAGRRATDSSRQRRHVVLTGETIACPAASTSSTTRWSSTSSA